MLAHAEVCHNALVEFTEYKNLTTSPPGDVRSFDFSMAFTIALNRPITGDDPPVRARRATRPEQPGAEEGEIPTLDLNQLERLLSRATEQDPEWQTINVRLPTTQNQQVTVTVDGGYRGQPQLRSTLVLDKETAEVQTLTTFSDQSAGQRLRSWLRFAHTGEFYGVGGQTVAGIASCSAVMLVLTGLSLSIRRFLAWIGQRRPTRTERSEHGPLAEEL